MRRVVTGTASPSQIHAINQRGKTIDMSLIGPATPQEERYSSVAHCFFASVSGGIFSSAGIFR